MNKWSEMRTECWLHCQRLYGKLTPATHPLFMKEIKRLQNIWKKDKEKFREAIDEKQLRHFIL